MKRSKLGFWLFLAPCLIAFLTIVLVPMLTGFYYSLTSWEGISTTKKFILTDEQTLLKTQLCNVGKTVYHTRYGKGEVISYSESHITVLFDIGEKILNLDTVVYNGYLSLSN